jgi:hypothetical protein
MPEGLPLLMDRAYEGDEPRQLVLSLGMIPVVPPKSNRIHPWVYDRALYKSAMKSNASSAGSKATPVWSRNLMVHTFLVNRRRHDGADTSPERHYD